MKYKKPVEIHPNGFVKAILREASATRLEIRLNYWEKRHHKVISDIHSHMWNFDSTILLGGMREESYERCRNGSKMEAIVKIVNSERQTAEERREQIHLTRTDIVERNAGDSYSKSHDQFHRVIIPPGGECCTIQRISKFIADRSYFIKSDDSIFHETDSVIKYDINGLLKLVSLALEENLIAYFELEHWWRNQLEKLPKYG